MDFVKELGFLALGSWLLADRSPTTVGDCARELGLTHSAVGQAAMAVTEKFQGRQIGKKLLLATIERARDMGVEQLYLVTNSSLTPAVTLYRKAGFRVTHCGQHEKYQRGDLTMELSLVEPS